MEWDWSYKSESVHLTMLPSFLSSVGGEFEKQDGGRPTLAPLFRIFDHGLNNLLHQLRDETATVGLGKDLVTSSLLQLIAARIFRLSKASLTVHSARPRHGRIFRERLSKKHRNS